MANLFIRPATIEDLPAIMTLYRHLSVGVYGEEPELPIEEARRIFRDIEEDPRQHLLVAETEGRVVGTVLLRLYPNLTHGGRPSGVLENMVVVPEYRRRGVGRAILEHVNKLARQKDCYKLSLTSNIFRTWAHTFYRRLGWKRTHYGYTLEP